MVITSACSFFAATSKASRVRVLGSKKRLTSVRPASRLFGRLPCWADALNCLATEKIVFISSQESAPISIKSFCFQVNAILISVHESHLSSVDPQKVSRINSKMQRLIEVIPSVSLVRIFQRTEYNNSLPRAWIAGAFVLRSTSLLIALNAPHRVPSF